MKKKKRIIIYGIGNNCNIFLNNAMYVDFTIIAYVDREKYGAIWRDQTIIHPSQIINLDYDEIYVTLSDNKEVISNLENLGVESYKIKTIEYINKKYMVNFNSKAKYILLTDGTKLYNYAYSELETLDNLEVWRLLYQKEKWHDTEEIFQNRKIFLVHSHCYGYLRNNGFINLLKKVYPNSRFILILSDMIDGEFGYRYRTDETKIDIDKERVEFDLITTYHPLDAKKYGFNFHLQPYTKRKLEQKLIEYDVFFVGNAKNRLNKLYDIYDYLSNNKFKCNFWITGVKEDLIDNNKIGIKYNQFLDYDNYLLEMSKSKCILEVCQLGDVTTMRYVEAITYGKKLISNDSTCINYPYYDEKYISVISDERDINLEWLKNDDTFQDENIEEFSPILLLKKLVKSIGENIDEIK